MRDLILPVKGCRFGIEIWKHKIYKIVRFIWPFLVCKMIDEKRIAGRDHEWLTLTESINS